MKIDTFGVAYILEIRALTKSYSKLIWCGMIAVIHQVTLGRTWQNIEAMGAAYISIAWKDAIAFVVLILILIVRPTGLLGERVAEKV